MLWCLCHAGQFGAGEAGVEQQDCQIHCPLKKSSSDSLVLYYTERHSERERATQHHFSLSNSTADGKSIHYTKWMLRGDAAVCVTPLLKPNGGVGCWLCWWLSMLWWFDRVLANKMAVNRGDVWISYMGSVLLYKPTCGFMQTSVQHHERSAY